MRKTNRLAICFQPLLVMLFIITLTSVACAKPMEVLYAKQTLQGAIIGEHAGTLEFRFLTPGVVRVIYHLQGTAPKLQQFVVTEKPEHVAAKLLKNNHDVEFRTSKMVVRVDRQNGSVAFLRPDGTVVLQEPASGGRKFLGESRGRGVVNDEPQQTFLAAPHEVLYGLAQTQGGMWNRRGKFIELRQFNTQCSIPMLVSSKGYGVLWNNASLTYFNPIDHQLKINAHRQASFVPKQNGQYIFAVRHGNRMGAIGIKLNGKTLKAIYNIWVPYYISAMADLKAGKPYRLSIIGGGKQASLWVRPRGDKTVFRSTAGNAIDYYYFAGPTPAAVISAYRRATGAAPLFPRWAYGFWQCRERYKSQKKILKAAEGFRERHIPVDLIIQDWLYWTGGWSSFRFDKTRYPDPREMIKKLHQMHFHYMISVWQNNTYHSAPYPPKKYGLLPHSKWLDVFDPKAGHVRWEHMKRSFFDIGVDGWWQDATEPEPIHLLDSGNCYLGPAPWYRNAYPFFANLNVYKGQRAATSAKRVVILSRSAYLGQQRVAAAVWSGDVHGNWLTLQRQIPAGLNYCMTGLPYWTTDTGGFFRPADQYKSKAYHELLVRWFQWSTFCPILRIHGYESRTEMWHYGNQTMDLLKKYDDFRYRMLPYIYSLAWQVTHNGADMMRPLIVDFPKDPVAAHISHEFMFGPAFLVAPVDRPINQGGGTRNVYLPKGADWINFWTGKMDRGGQQVQVASPLDRIPLFVRAGSIVPLGPVVQYAGAQTGRPITLRIYPGHNADFTLYNDHGNGYAYENGAYTTIKLQWNDRQHKLTIGKRHGEFPGMPKNVTFNVVIVKSANGTGMKPAGQIDATVHYDGNAVTVSF